MKKLFAIILAVHASLLTFHEAKAQIIKIPDDYPTIQQGIDAAEVGDTVLVQPGTYIEKISFDSKNITIGSLYLTTLDTSYISQTIIDCDSIWGSVVIITGGQDSTAVLCGFTITGGNGGYAGGGIYCEGSSPKLISLKITGNTAWNGGGVSIENSSPIIRDVSICGNSAYNDYTGGSCCPDAAGGGIRCIQASPVLVNVDISDNLVMSIRGSTCGGGIYCFRSNMVLQDVTITNNIVDYNTKHYSSGGGISCYDSTLYFSNVRITGNSAKKGGGISGYSTIVFDSINRSDIFLNKACYGNDLYNAFGEIVTDTFTVLSPTEFHAYPIENYFFNILNGKFSQVEADLYVSPDGDNFNSGLSQNEPLKNAWCAFSKIIADSIHPHTIHFQDGTYSWSSNEEVFPFSIRDYISLSGESENNVILEAEGRSGVLLLDNIKETDITGLTLKGGVARNGGGIECISSNALLKNIRITGNTASYYDGCDGGGIYISNSGPTLENMIIDSNNAVRGGGLFCSEEANPVLKNVTIRNNFASDKGGGLFCNRSFPAFDSISRCNIYLNSALWGNDLYADTTFQITLDTFTVIYPHEFHTMPIENYAFDILQGKLDQVDTNLYVSPAGNDENSGTTSDFPLKTIHRAILKIRADSLHQNTIQLLDGAYSTSVSGEVFPVNLPNQLNLQGALESGVILDAEMQSGVILIDHNSSNHISGLTITGGSAHEGGGICCRYSNPFLEDLTIKNNTGIGSGWIYFGCGGGLYCYYSNPEMKNITISDNASRDGGGIYCDNSNPEMQDVILFNNRALIHGDINGGGGLYCINSYPILKSVIISNNEASNGGGIFCVHSHPNVLNTQITGNNVLYGGNPYGGKGGGIYCINSDPVFSNVTVSGNTAMVGGSVYADPASRPSITNSILWDNSPSEVTADSIFMTHSDIPGGWTGEGNIDADPLFMASGDHPYAIMDGSPCIDNGTPDTTGLNLPMWDLIGNYRMWDGNGDGDTIVDMGAYEFGALPVSVPEFRVPEFQVSGFGFQVEVYPNPASGEVVFSVSGQRSAVSGEIRICICDLFGREIRTLMDEIKSQGEYTVRVDISDLPAGVYLVRLQAGGQSAVRKLVVQ